MGVTGLCGCREHWRTSGNAQEEILHNNGGKWFNFKKMLKQSKVGHLDGWDNMLQMSKRLVWLGKRPDDKKLQVCNSRMTHVDGLG